MLRPDDLAALVSSGAFRFFVTTILPVWFVGLLTGLAFPRQAALSSVGGFISTAVASAVSMGTRSTLLSQIMMFVNGAMFIQSLWYRWTDPGTFHRLCASTAAYFGLLLPKTEKEGPGWEEKQPADESAAKSWCVTEDDLSFFRRRAEQEHVPNAGPLETLIQKDIPGVLKYHAQRRMLTDTKKTEYLTTSITADSCPHEVMDFYWSDPERQKWDNMLTTAETLESGSFKHREQIVHWVRSFPFSFLSDRDYVIGRRVFERDGVLYGISKVVDYPAHDPGRLVRMENYWSMWSCAPCPCPFGSGKPATKTVLLHMEDFKIPENLSRFAVKHGMWGFMKQMVPSQVEFIKARRARGIDPNSPDPEAFGANDVPLRTGSAAGNSANGSGGMRTRAPSDGSLSSRGSAGSKVSKLRRVGSTVLAAGMLVALTASGSQPNMRRQGSCRSQASLRVSAGGEEGAADDEERADAQA